MEKEIKLLKRSLYILFMVLLFVEILPLSAVGQNEIAQSFNGSVYINGVIAGPGHLIDARNASGSSKIESGSDIYTDVNSTYGNNISARFYVNNLTEGETIYFFVDNYASNTSLFSSGANTYLDLSISSIVINITNPENNSINTTGNVNVMATLDKNGTAQLNWNGVNYTMNPNTTSPAGTVFYYNMTGLVSGYHSFKVYANGTQLPSVSETRTIYVTPAQINITNPANNSINTTGNVNVTATLDKNGTAQLNWNGVNYTMNPNTTSPAGTVFYYNFSGLLSGNYSFKVYAYDGTNLSNVSETRTIYITPAQINITNPENNSIDTTGNVNVTVIHDKIGTAQLNWNGVNYTMNPTNTSPAGTVFHYNFSGLLSGNYSFKVYSYDGTNLSNVSETRIITVNRTVTANISVNNATGNVSQRVDIPAPSGNATLTIFNGTNATLNGSTFINISIDSLNQVNTTYVLLGGNKFIGENLSLSPGGARFTPDLQIRINYTHAQLTAAGIDELTLTAKFYNASAAAWETLTIYERNTTADFLIANISHFSVIAITGTPPTSGGNQVSSGGSGSSSGYIESGGKGCVKSGENRSNIEDIEKYDMQISKDIITSYRFIHSKSPIMFVNITGNTNLGLITASIEVLKSTSNLVNILPDGLVYKNANICVETGSLVTPKNLKDASIKFRVNNDWMIKNGVPTSDIVLLKWDGISWIMLETKALSKDDTDSYFEGKTDSFSPFAIGAKKAEVEKPQVIETAPAPAGVSKSMETVEPEPTKKTPGFGFVLAIAGLMAVVLRKRSW